jgi:hypothetical protein
MIRFGRLLLYTALGAVVFQAQAQDEASLTRDDVTLFKKKLVAVFESLGQPPPGYAMDRESFNLPTDAYLIHGTKNYRPTQASASRTYGSEKSAEDASKNFEQEYKKKILEAQAKGDYEAMGRLAQEMQSKAGELALKTEESKKEPISVNVGLNESGGEVIDPDAVVHEQSGVIVLKRLDATPERGEVRIYVDPVSLKDTKQLSKVSLDPPEEGVAKRTTVLTATISFYGPAQTIEAWSKKVDFKKVLSQIDR